MEKHEDNERIVYLFNGNFEGAPSGEQSMRHPRPTIKGQLVKKDGIHSCYYLGGYTKLVPSN